MRQLHTEDDQKVLMLDLIIDNITEEYNSLPEVEKKYHSRAEKIGYRILQDLESNGFITSAGIIAK